MKASLTLQLWTPVLLLALGLAPVAKAQDAGPAATTAAAADANRPTALLSQDELQKLIPATVFFRGQSSTVQIRNAGGIRFHDGAILFAVKVDTGGYSTSIQERYQDYFISEVPVRFGGDHVLPAGAYGLGFVGPNLLVLDLGGNTIFSVPVQTDAELRRPRPLQMLESANKDTFRLYSGKQYVEFSRAAKP